MKHLLLGAVILVATVESVAGILCYQCSSAHSMYCSDMLVADEASPFKPEPCDHVFEAEYCIKSTAMHGSVLASVLVFGVVVFPLPPACL
uniref:Protein quiver n=1 Tax=Anopheles atroparvus TaxID=41427 RepID=A0AAG5D9S5_ANOAO